MVRAAAKSNEENCNEDQDPYPWWRRLLS